MIENNFLHALGWALLNSLWQMALLWVLFQVITGAFRHLRSLHKSSLATILLVAGFTWFLLTFFSIYSNTLSDDTIVSSSIINIKGNEELNNWLRNTLPAAAAIYILLLILPIMQFVRNYRYVQLIRRKGLGKADLQWRIFVKKFSAYLGIRKNVRIWMSEFIASPVTIGFLKPVILLPIAAVNNLSPQQMEAVLLHELSHIRRYDYLINLLINSIQTLLYFNPFVKAFVKTVEREREKSCDEMVMQFQYDRHDYASALLILEKNNHTIKPFAVGASGKKNDLLQRIELILGVNKKPVISFNRIAGLFAGSLFVIALNALILFGKTERNRESVSFMNLTSPFIFSIDESNNSKPVAAYTDNYTSKEKIKTTPISVSAEKNQTQVAVSTNRSNEKINTQDIISPFMNAKFQSIEIPRLEKSQEEQVQKAIDLSKRVIEETEWKNLEKNIADALTTEQKDILKAEYEKEISKTNLERWENKLRLSYNQIDWNRVNEQLGIAITNIRFDSLQKVYTDAIIQLSDLQKEITNCHQKGIPDTDITLQSIQKEKDEAKKLLNRVKAARNKKIIHL